MKIPKYIHYCWFGDKEMPTKYRKYIAGWKKIFPEYDIICWNEDNFPINEFKYAKQALENKKYAFVSDVARMYALEKMGGIYFDTDVQVIRSFEELLFGNEAVLGIESVEEQSVGTGFMAFCQGHKIPKLFLEYYKKTAFVLEDGSFNMKTNTLMLASILKQEYGIYPSDKIQQRENMVIYPQEYFTAFNGFTEITENTYCIHHFAASWQNDKEKIKLWLRKKRNRCIYRIRNLKK